MVLLSREMIEHLKYENTASTTSMAAHVSLYKCGHTCQYCNFLQDHLAGMSQRLRDIELLYNQAHCKFELETNEGHTTFELSVRLLCEWIAQLHFALHLKR